MVFRNLQEKLEKESRYITVITHFRAVKLYINVMLTYCIQPENGIYGRIDDKARNLT